MIETATPTTAASATNPDRDARGRFAEGNAGGPGNPFARKMASLRRAMLNAVSDQDMAEVTEAVLRKAKGGDLAAAKLLYTYVPGKPSPAPDPDAMDAHEMHTYFARTVPMAQATELMQGFPLDVLLAILPHVLQARAQAVSGQVTDGVPAAQEQHQKEQDKKARREERKRKYHEEREARRAERRRQRELERQAATLPSANGSNGQAKHTYPPATPPSPNGVAAVDAGQWVPKPPSPNGEIVPLTQEQWEAIMRQLLDGNELPEPDAGT